jgi:four helix bundle protein
VVGCAPEFQGLISEKGLQMTKIARFEDLIAWQKARQLTKDIYTLTKTGEFARDFGLSGQMQRACVSIMSNIAEGFERGGKREFRQFLSIAKGSCAELRSQLYVAFDIQYLEKPIFDNLLKRAEEVGRIIGGLRSSIKATSDRKKV